MKIVVLGAGAWGTALAVATTRGVTEQPLRHHVTLWARDPLLIDSLQETRENRRYLPGIGLPAGLALSAVPLQAVPKLLDDAALVVLATPIAALREMLQAMPDCRAPLVWLCKGFETGDAGAPGRLPHEVQEQVAPKLRCGVLSGPSFALEVAQTKPTALVGASVHAALRQTLVEAFHSACLRIYVNDDLIGVEVGGAVKNVLAIACGLCDGLGLGQNARAALITRGLAELSRFGLAMGARAETFMGLSGLGDLVLTATGDLSRNRQVGLALAQGHSLKQIQAALGHVAEGVYCAKAVAQRAALLNVNMPVTQAVVKLLDGRVTPAQVIGQLMAREPTGELT